MVFNFMDIIGHFQFIRWSSTLCQRAIVIEQYNTVYAYSSQGIIKLFPVVNGFVVLLFWFFPPPQFLYPQPKFNKRKKVQESHNQAWKLALFSLFQFCFDLHGQ